MPKPSGDTTAITVTVQAQPVFDTPGELSLEGGSVAGTQPALSYVANLGHSSQRVALNSLTSTLKLLGQHNYTPATFPWAQLRYAHTSVLRALLSEKVEEQRCDRTLGYSPSTANQMLAHLRGVLKECWKLRLMTADDYERAIDLKPIKGSSPDSGRALSDREMTILWQTCAADLSAMGDRDLAMLALLHAGLRREEVVSVDLEDVNFETGEIAVRYGKGGKSGNSYVQGPALECAKSWVKLRGDSSGPFLLPFRKGGHIEFRRLTPQSVYSILKQRAAEANAAAGKVAIAPFSPHDLRRTFATNLYRAGVDTPTVQRLMRHSNPATTMRYDKRADEVKLAAVQKLPEPKFRIPSRDRTSPTL
jgi:integrase